MSVHKGKHVVGYLPTRVQKLLPTEQSDRENRLWDEAVLECENLGLLSLDEVYRRFNEKVRNVRT